MKSRKSCSSWTEVRPLWSVLLCPQTQEVGRLEWNPRTGSLRAGIGPVCREADSTGPHFLFLTCGTSPTFSVLKQDLVGPGPFPWRLFMPGLALSLVLCCSHLLLRSWYKYQTFSWTGYSWDARQQADLKESWKQKQKEVECRVEKV